ncbi:hypothetical protein [Epilithonimonas caeni]|uniref:hypothetical protein n=1 Tax=Epilithonimonas caeni TaxID=365343 RepID=UPI00048441BD|nr:hypothetical protein [Epilithonimonas caeni]
MLFTDLTFFKNEPFKISNINEMGDVALEISRFIYDHEKQCLILVLGQELYNELQDCFDTDNNLKDDAPEHLKALINGISYEVTVNDIIKKKEWKGIVQKDSFKFNGTDIELRSSFIADYIYYHYNYNYRTSTTGVGQVILTAANSFTVSGFPKRIDAYNSFQMKVVGGIKNQTSLYEFLRDHKEDFPTWKPSHIEPKNKF